MKPLALLLIFIALLVSGCSKPNPLSRKQQLEAFDREHPGVEGGGENSP